MLIMMPMVMQDKSIIEEIQFAKEMWLNNSEDHVQEMLQRPGSGVS
ncbi:MAG: hypothetical protein ETSY1_11290 [Candidatus Entotheonella factor]|uniref:Uncharacterized protein n=1 Tax=Entotheonella factor TaxID=1429438 RepID=W4LQU3_ENTF1|nr:MAG: hypothetical protein ETSY1_11290 [Candidatus Entotheonella factor]